MDFLIKNKKKIDIGYIASVILELVVSYLLNRISQDGFDFLASHNIVLIIIFIVSTVAYIIIKVLIRNDKAKRRKKRLVKAFEKSGGYEMVADELKECIANRDYDNFKKITKMMNLIGE